MKKSKKVKKSVNKTDKKTDKKTEKKTGNKNTKIIIGVGVLALLLIAYKKGVFGGSEGGNGGNGLVRVYTW